MGTLLKCKICGGDLEATDRDVATCLYCGSKQMLPKMTNERKKVLYDRASNYREKNEFDKALALYEQVLLEDNTDAEVYWDMVLCRYGIEYVEDPRTKKRIPTVNRAQFKSIFEDKDYLSALKYATAEQCEVLEHDAETIDKIQQGILEISNKEEPYDIFICYKETDNNGRRTPDSVIAQDLYTELEKEGYKVFFSRITLEDKIGSAYEPYIFAAINSAKIMITIGTRKENFNAVWVKNEWSRYLALINSGEEKTLIPAYRDMNPYDLPEEFSHLQAQDMNKLGAMQDLIRGIQKIIGCSDSHSGFNENSVNALLMRGQFSLEDKEWEKAKTFFDEALNINPQNGEAYVGLLLAELKLESLEKLEGCNYRFDLLNEYKKAVRFSDRTIIDRLNKAAESVNVRLQLQAESEKKRKLKRRHKIVKCFSVFFVVSIATCSLIFGINQYNKNSKDKMYDLLYETLSEAEIGELVQFGNYEGKTEWLVVDKVDNEKILIMSFESIAYMNFNDEHKYESWEKCTLREWLNNEFYEKTFSEAEKAKILMVETPLIDSDQWRTEDDKTVQDKVSIPTTKNIHLWCHYKDLFEKESQIEDKDTMNFWMCSIAYYGGTPYADCAYRKNNSFNSVKTQVDSLRGVCPVIWVDISDK